MQGRASEEDGTFLIATAVAANLVEHRTQAYVQVCEEAKRETDGMRNEIGCMGRSRMDSKQIADGSQRWGSRRGTNVAERGWEHALVI